jgi:hypothetical protein
MFPRGPRVRKYSALYYPSRAGACANDLGYPLGDSVAPARFFAPWDVTLRRRSDRAQMFRYRCEGHKLGVLLAMAVLLAPTARAGVPRAYNLNRNG